MHKAIGFITCASVMAVSLYLFSGGDPSRTLSAQTDSASGDSYGSVARRFMQDARKAAQEGNTEEARRIAEAANALPTQWSPTEQSPAEFLRSLDSAGSANTAPVDWATIEESAKPGEPSENPFSEAAQAAEETGAVSLSSSDLLKKKQAQRLITESRQALVAGDIAMARSRALQAKQLNAHWGLWDDRPEHVLSEIDAADKTTTFAGTAPAAAGTNVPQSQEYAKAATLLQQARLSMDAGNLDEAKQFAEQAASLNVTYGMFEDSPTLVLRDVERLSGASSSSSAFSSSVADNSSQATQARELLRVAREAMAQGRLGEARQKADQAKSLNVIYGVLDDRPELVINDIDLALRGHGQNGLGNANLDVATQQSETARSLVSQARSALNNGDVQQAHQLAQQAQQRDTAFGLMEDRPELIMEEANAIAQRDAGRSGSNAFAFRSPVDMTPASASNVRSDGNGAIAPVSYDAGSDFAVIRPDGESADAAYHRGLALLRSGKRTEAKAAFTAAWQNAGELDGQKRRQLQEFMQELAGDSTNPVQLVSARQEGQPVLDITDDGPMAPMSETDPLTAAAEQSDVRYTRLRTEVMNSVFRAEKLKDENPDEALEILDNTLATVEAAPLSAEAIETLAGYVQRSQTSIRQWKEQLAPRYAQEARNRNIREQIEISTKAQIRIEQEIADLTEQYNQLMRERRYAEAELVAKKARDLNPKLPATVIMVEKAKLQRQIAFNEDLRERKAEGFLDVMNGVEESAIPFAGEYALPDAKSWKELTSRREKFGHADARQRTESEQQIEKSLGQKVSLHFHDVPLAEVIRHIATVHGINIAVKSRALETEGLTANQPVSIDVDGIQLKSALNLLLDQAGGLVYAIENETLMISNRLEQETRFVNRVYNVADLVVPYEVPTQRDPFGMPTGLESVNSAAGGLFQVNDELAVNIGPNGSPRSGRSGSGSRDNDFSGLIDLITTTVEPGSWSIDGGDGQVATNENTLSLVIRQTAAVHDQISDLLSQLRKLQDLQVTVEVRFISVSDRFFERIGVDFDFNVQDTLGDPAGAPAFGSRQLTFPGTTTAGGGGGGGGQQAGDLRGGTQQGGQQGGQQGQQGQAGITQGLFDTINRVNTPRDDFNGQVVGLSGPNQFSQDYDIQFRQGSFEIGVPDFGNYNPDAGIQVGLAILSDIEAFFFIQAAQADERSNIMFAPKVTLFNGQFASVNDNTQRYLVVGQTPVVGTGAVGFQPIIQPFTDGITLSVVAVISADRRYVRLSLAPFFSNIIDIQTFTQVSFGGAAGIGGGGGGGFGGGGGGIGGGGGGGFGGGGGGIGGFGGIGGGGGGFGGGGGGGGGFGGGGGGQQGQQGQQGGGSSAGTVQLPVIATVNVSTTVSVPDGGTVLLGGVKRLREGRNMAGVPILNKIPYISRLFKNSGVGRETESIMLMVTPRIIIQEEEEELIIGTAAQ